MSRAELGPDGSSLWSDRLFAAIPVPPVWVGLGLAAALLGVLVLVTSASGELAAFLEQEQRWWQERDARMAVLVALVASIAITARPYARAGAERTLEDLRGSVDFAPGQLELARRELRHLEAGRAWRVGLLGLAVDLVDRGFLWATAVMGSLSVACAAAGLWLTARGIQARIRVEKHAELARVREAIRGDREALRQSAIGARADTASLSDLLAYRSTVEGVREWPFDPTTRVRLALYVAIPVGSWLGGAVVERLLEALLG